MSQNKQNRAFTLIELLVVISIISLLIALLLPALSSARQASLAITCATRMKQVGYASEMYNHDFKNWMAPVFDNWQDNPSQKNALKGGPWPARLMPYMGGSTLRNFSTLFYCPAIADPHIYREDAIGLIPVGTNAKHSYGFNVSMGDIERIAAQPSAITYFSMKRRDDVELFSPMAPILTEVKNSRLAHTLRWDVINYSVSLSPGPTNTVRFPHLSARSNVLYIDGHVTPSNEEEMWKWPRKTYEIKQIH